MNKKVLIVEDNQINLLTLQLLFQNFNFDVVGTRTNAENILNDVAELAPDLIVMDVMIEGNVDGLQASELIRTMYSTPILFITALSDIGSVSSMKNFTNTSILNKPFDEESLLTESKRLIGH